MRETLTILLILLSGSLASADPLETAFSEIPAKFEQFQDSRGFLWQVNKEAAITSGETQYLPSGMKLFVDGKAVTPTGGKWRRGEDRIELALDSKSGEIEVQRAFLFDLERAGVRLLDRFTNKGKQPARVKVEFKSAYQFPWQNLVGTSGRILAGGAGVNLTERDIGVTTKFSAADGRQDTIYLVRGSRGGSGPAISTSSNSREIVFAYTLEIAPGKSVSLVHWMLRRNVGNPEEIESLTRDFYQRHQLVAPGIKPEAAGTLVNYPASAVPEPTVQPERIGELVALNEFLALNNLARRGKDVLYLGGDNVLAGDLAAEALVLLGEESWPVDAVAAIRGGGGKGLVPQVFFRDGSVRTGDIKLENFALLINEQWSVTDQWNPAELNLLLCDLDKTDGVAPEGTAAYLELHSGDIFALAAEPAPVLEMVTVLGTRSFPVGEITGYRYQKNPRPEYRIFLPDGTALGGVPTQEKLEFQNTGGRDISVSPGTIKRIWINGRNTPPSSRFRQTWLEWADIPEDMVLSGGFLLRGNNLAAGSFAETATLSVIENGTVLDVAASQIVSLRRLKASSYSSLPRFELELLNGDTLRGGIRQNSVPLADGGRLPVRHVIGFRREGGTQ